MRLNKIIESCEIEYLFVTVNIETLRKKSDLSKA